MRLLSICFLTGGLAAGTHLYAQSAQKASGQQPPAAVPAQSARPQSAAQLPKGDAARGKAAFEQCVLCHDPNAWRTGGLLARKGGPPLRHLYSKSKLSTTGKPVNDDNVLEVINNGGKGMVAFRDTLTAQQKADLLAYLKSQ